jgi:hypothetical protein
MRKHTLIFGLLVVAAFVFGYWSSILAAPVEAVIPYQTKVSLSYPKNYTFRFSLWDAEIGGNEVWAEVQEKRLTSATLKVNLGEGTPEGVGLGEVDFSQQLFVQLQRYRPAFDDYVVVGTRQPFTMIPYAMWSATSASGGTITQVVAGQGLTSDVVGDQVTLNVEAGAGISVADDSVAIAAGGVTTTMLSDGAVTDAKITGPISAAKLAMHTHAGGDITSGTVGAAYIDAAIARDSEIMPAVIAGAAYQRPSRGRRRA